MSATATFIPGAFSLLLKEGDTLNDLGARIAGYNKERFKAVAVRFYSGEETIVTIYAQDMLYDTSRLADDLKLPVHKFKVICTQESFFNEIQLLNFTISGTEYIIDDMEVTNK